MKKQTLTKLLLIILIALNTTFCLRAKKSPFDFRSPSSIFGQIALNSITACQSSASEKDISLFSFPISTTGLSADYTGVISGTDIKVSIPYGVDNTSLIASFTTTGTSVKIGSVLQTDGVTANDFSNPIIYTVTGSDGCTKDYIVTATKFNPVLSTGVTTCYEDLNPIGVCPCGNASFPNQNGDFANSGSIRSFSAPTANASYPSDYITKDTLSGGLTWKSCLEGKTGVSCTGTSNLVDWNTAVNLCTALNSSNAGAGYAGKTDWRLPSIQELRSIANFGVNTPAIDVSSFPGTTSIMTWSSNVFAGVNSYGVLFNLGSIVANGQSNNYAVRCVSGTTIPSSSLVDNGDGTITDNTSKLRWQKCPLGTTISGSSCMGTPSASIWRTALVNCANLGFLGKSWRLPNINELQSILDYTVTTAPYQNQTYFPVTPPADYFWSSTTLNSLASSAWSVLFSAGNVPALLKGNTANGYTRCVTDDP